MFGRMLLSAVAVVAGTAMMAQALPKDDVVAAAQKLSEADSYSWTTTVEGGFGGNTTGKTQKDGLAALTNTARGTDYDVIVEPPKAVIKTADGWKTAAELATPGDGGPNPGMFVAMQVQNYKTPATMAREISNQLDDVKQADDGYTAVLLPEAVKKLMQFRRPRPGQDPNAPPPEIKNAAGEAKFWIKDGVIVKAQIHVTGTMSFNGNDRDIDRTTTTEIKDIGATKIEVPDEAKAKLAEAPKAPATAPAPQ